MELAEREAVLVSVLWAGRCSRAGSQRREEPCSLPDGIRGEAVQLEMHFWNFQVGLHWQQILKWILTAFFWCCEAVSYHTPKERQSKP